jgi:hypothetical protein
LQEREQAFEDIHGVSKIIDEDPDFVDQCLLLMDMELRRLKKQKKQTSAYETALFLAPRLVMDREFRLMFLRAESFDPKKALHRMVKYFESKLELFGFDKLVKTITQEDLHEDAKEALRVGMFQPLPAKDQSGRNIIFITPKHHQRKANLNHVRFIKARQHTSSHPRVIILILVFCLFLMKLGMAWYVMMTTLQGDEDAQRNGFVFIVYYGTDSGSPLILQEHFARVKMCRKVWTGLPFRTVGVHAWYNDFKVRPLMSVIPALMEKMTRIRFRSHYGES